MLHAQRQLADRGERAEDAEVLGRVVGVVVRLVDRRRPEHHLVALEGRGGEDRPSLDAQLELVDPEQVGLVRVAAELVQAEQARHAGAAGRRRGIQMGVEPGAHQREHALLLEGVVLAAVAHVGRQRVVPSAHNFMMPRTTARAVRAPQVSGAASRRSSHPTSRRASRADRRVDAARACNWHAERFEDEAEWAVAHVEEVAGLLLRHSIQFVQTGDR